MIKKQKGVALILVLTMLSILVSIATNYVLSVSRETESIDIVNNRTQARYSALAGVQYALFAMQERDKTLRWTVDGKLFMTELAGGKIAVRIMPETGRIDINHANIKLLSLLFEYAGLTEEEAIKVASNVAHWRNAEDTQIEESVFDADYISIAIPPPKHRSFFAIEEITQVLGVNLAIYSKIKPLITIYGSSRINIFSASDEVLKVLQLTDEDIASIQRARIAFYENEEPFSADIQKLSPYLHLRANGSYYRVLSYAETSNGSSETIYTVIHKRQNQYGSFRELERGFPTKEEREQLIDMVKKAREQ